MKAISMFILSQFLLLFQYEDIGFESSCINIIYIGCFVEFNLYLVEE